LPAQQELQHIRAAFRDLEREQVIGARSSKVDSGDRPAALGDGL